MRRTMLTTAGILAIMLLLYSVPQATGGMRRGRGMMHGKRGYVQQCLEKLNLTDTQKDEIAAILTRHKGEREALSGRLEKARKNLKTVMLNDQSTEGDVRAAWRKLSKVREEMLVLRFKERKEVFKVLTPQQREQVKTMIAEMGNRHKKRMRERERMLMNWLKGGM